MVRTAQGEDISRSSLILSSIITATRQVLFGSQALCTPSVNLQCNGQQVSASICTLSLDCFARSWCVLQQLTSTTASHMHILVQ